MKLMLYRVLKLLITVYSLAYSFLHGIVFYFYFPNFNRIFFFSLFAIRYTSLVNVVIFLCCVPHDIIYKSFALFFGIIGGEETY